jgi:hypothetical protein
MIKYNVNMDGESCAAKWDGMRRDFAQIQVSPN